MNEYSLPDNLVVNNYCLLFADILGQRDAFAGEALLPRITTPEEKKAFFDAKIGPTVGKVIALQKRAHNMVSSVVDARDDSEFRLALQPQQRSVWDEMQRTKIVTQYWSDGLASFSNLGDSEIKCRMNGVYGLFTTAGALCLTGLAMKQPLRGAIDVAWGMEIRPGELYGPVVANAYHLENDIAQYPRIVIGDRVIEMLRLHAEEPGTDVFTGLNRELAKLCARMVGRDVDGQLTLHYLGKEFRESVSKASHKELYTDAHTFIQSERKRFRDLGNQKLALRYALLDMYFQGNASP